MKLKTINTVLNHPLNKTRKIKAFLSLILRGIIIRLHKYPIIYPYISNTSLVVEKGMSSAELQIYCGLYDYEEMLLMMHFLRENDNFCDVGANVGVYTVLASGVSKANSYSFEPVPSTFNRLERNVFFNKLEGKIKLYNNGVGEKKGNLNFTNNLDAINHVINEPIDTSIKVEVNCLDNFLKDTSIDFLKIDVEGFEEFVLNGARLLLKNSRLKIILVETNGLTNNYDSSDDSIGKILTEQGFECYSYLPKTRQLVKENGLNTTNTIFCRDIDFITRRVIDGPKIRIFENSY